MNFHQRLMNEARQAGFALALTVLAGITGGVLIVAQARQLSRVVARVFLERQGPEQVRTLLVGLLIIVLLRALAALAGEVAASAVAVRVKTRLRRRLFDHLLALGPAYASGERSGELATAAVQGVEALDSYYSQYLPQVILAAALPLLMLLAVFPLDALSGVALALTAPLIPIFMVLIGRGSEALTRRQFTALSRMSAFFLDTLQGLATLKALGQGKRHAARVESVSQRYRTATLNVLRITFLSALVLELIATLSTAVIAVQIGLRLLYGRLAFEQAFFILVIAPDFYQPLRQLGARFHAGMSGVAAAQRIFAILDTPLPMMVSAQPRQPLPVAPYTIRFEEVGYTYPGRPAPAVQGVSFALDPGEQLALVGASGAGKSTLAALLMGFLAPQSGRITLNGVDLGVLDAEEWRRAIGWAPQRAYLLNASLADNMRIANQDADASQIRAALGQAGLLAWVESLPYGLETPIGEGGARLSGGQAQRLALARAFLRDAPLLVLDEPTAQLDPENEACLVETIQRLCHGRSVLTIAHRFPTAARAGRILVLSGGHIIEQGSHVELLAQGGAYARLAAAYRGQP